MLLNNRCFALVLLPTLDESEGAAVDLRYPNSQLPTSWFIDHGRKLDKSDKNYQRNETTTKR